MMPNMVSAMTGAMGKATGSENQLDGGNAPGLGGMGSMMGMVMGGKSVGGTSVGGMVMGMGGTGLSNILSTTTGANAPGLGGMGMGMGSMMGMDGGIIPKSRKAASMEAMGLDPKGMASTIMGSGGSIMGLSGLKAMSEPDPLAKGPEGVLHKSKAELGDVTSMVSSLTSLPQNLIKSTVSKVAPEPDAESKPKKPGLR